MRNIQPKSMNRILAAMLAAAPLIAGASAGEFSFVTGEVTLIKANGQRSTPVKGTPVDPGDRVTTGANGMAQLTMVDNARLSLRPATNFQIESYPQRPESTDGAVFFVTHGHPLSTGKLTVEAGPTVYEFPLEKPAAPLPGH